MKVLKDKLNALMAEIKKENPGANWGNLMTGIIIVVLLAIFSVWYFEKSPEDQNALLGDLFNSEEELVVETKDEEAVDMTTVEAGEGLWHVAKRVCGDGEKYNFLASANDLTIWSNIQVGQELIVKCE